MKNSIILPLNYEKVFMIEARKSGLIKHVEIPNAPDLYGFDHYEEELYKRCYRLKQNLFQMILLYDELIIQDSDPTYEYDKIENIGNFKIYPFDDFYYYNARELENNVLYAEYLKPAILGVLKKNLRHCFAVENCKKVSYNKMISELYDAFFKIREDISKNVMELLELNEVVYKIKNRKNINRLKNSGLPNEFTERTFAIELASLFTLFYDQLCWQLKISSEQDAYIVNSEFQLSKIGCDIYEENINTYMDAYKILKCECANIIGTLPHISSIEEAILLKEKRKKDIMNLREVMGNLENVLRTEGKEKAIIKATSDVRKASSALSKCEKVNKIGKWTTLLSVPMGIAEMLLGGGIGGLGISVIGAATCLIDEKIKRNNSWCEIVR
ncbi:MAG: hypothetical protein HDR02_17810 [Lachnospiraceae bacterium]|nr:hypothetical protein [Lachnospiraceae bacterium]